MISLPFSLCWPYFEAGMLFGGFSSTRVTNFNLGSGENPYFEKLADSWQIWPYSMYRGPDSHMQSGASPGSSVGDTNDWILFLWFILIVFCPWFRSATSHPVQNTQNHRFFDPKHHFLTHERPKNKKIDLFQKSHDAGGLPNGMSVFRMRHFWSPKAHLGHVGQNHHKST